jgi:peptide chain release factor 1
VYRGAGFAVLRVTGREAERCFAREGGGHRWQRVPPNEKRGRVHTSTVTVVVLPEPTPLELELDPRDLVISTCRASGNGGQHLQRTESAVQIKHVPTGVMVRCESERSQLQNRASALAVLRARLLEREREGRRTERERARREQAGSGMRGDKRRTVRCQDATVTDHVTGQRWSLREYERGDWELA